jgi:hypothetical protein
MDATCMTSLVGIIETRQYRVILLASPAVRYILDAKSNRTCPFATGRERGNGFLDHDCMIDFEGVPVSQFLLLFLLMIEIHSWQKIRKATNIVKSTSV